MDKNNDNPKQMNKHTWKKGQPALFIIIYMAVNIIIAILYKVSGGNDVSALRGFITLILLIYLIYVAITEKGRWKTVNKIFLVIGGWILFAVLQAIAAVVILLPIITIIGRPLSPDELLYYYLDFSSTLIAALPIMIWSMQHSKAFVVEKIQNIEPDLNHGIRKNRGQ